MLVFWTLFWLASHWHLATPPGWLSTKLTALRLREKGKNDLPILSSKTKQKKKLKRRHRTGEPWKEASASKSDERAFLSTVSLFFQPDTGCHFGWAQSEIYIYLQKMEWRKSESVPRPSLADLHPLSSLSRLQLSAGVLTGEMYPDSFYFSVIFLFVFF